MVNTCVGDFLALTGLHDKATMERKLGLIQARLLRLSQTFKRENLPAYVDMIHEIALGVDLLTDSQSDNPTVGMD
jgi:hypothetical protein